MWDRQTVGESWWSRIRGKTGKANNIVGMNYRPASPGEEVGESFFKQVAEVSASQTPALLGGFNLPDILQEDSLAGHNQSKFLESIRGKFPIQVLDGPSSVNAQLDLLFTKKEALVGHVVISGNTGYSDHKIVVFKIPRGVKKESSRSQILDFRIDLPYSKRQKQTIPKLRISIKCIGHQLG